MKQNDGTTTPLIPQGQKPMAGNVFDIVRSTSLSGPWNTTEVTVVVLEPDIGYWADPGHKGNPAPFIFPNGTVLVRFWTALALSRMML
jgi:hypothetical protein